MRRALQKISALTGICMLVGVSLTSTWPVAAATLLAPLPLISAGLPAYTSDDCFTSKPASDANSGNYSAPWRSCNNPPSLGSPVTLTYDLSTISSANRTNDVLVWFNDDMTGNYNPTLNNNNYYNTPKDYTIQGNVAASSGTPPASGWVTLTTVTNNPYHSRQHALNLASYNWVRISFTASDGMAPNSDIGASIDLHNASNGRVTDDWMFFGDSITQSGLLNDDSNGQTFAQQINAAKPNYYPIAESGGIGGFTSGNVLPSFSTWLSLFPGTFVALNYGTNDANSNLSPDTFYSNMATMAQDVIAAGKIPIIPTIPWGCTANLTTNVPIFNTKIQALYTAYPQIIAGPDLYTYFQNNQSYVSNDDCIHPGATGGWTAYRSQWAQAMLSAVYTAPVASISPAAGNVTTNQTATLSSTKAGSIHYTTDGSTPTTASPTYTTSLILSSTTTIKVLAVDQAGNQSDIISSTYTFPVTNTGGSGNQNQNQNNTNTAQTVQASSSFTASTKTTPKTTTQPAGAIQYTARTPTNLQTPIITPAIMLTPSTVRIRTLILTLTDTTGRPLRNVSTTLENLGQTATSNSDGTVVFYNVMPGAYTLSVSSTRYGSSPRIQVVAGTDSQRLTVKLAALKTFEWSWTVTAMAGGTTLFLAICILFVVRHKRNVRLSH